MLNDDGPTPRERNCPTPSGRARLLELYIEQAEERQLASDLNLLAALRLGAALQRQKEETGADDDQC